MQSIKQQLYKLCANFLSDNIRSIEAAIAEAREATANETKSSMGDKYETTREMLQQDINMNMERLAKTKAELASLQIVNPEQTSEITTAGSLVYTNLGNYYIAVSAGNFMLENEKYYAISPASPLGLQLKGKCAGDSFILNGKQFLIKNIL